MVYNSYSVLFDWCPKNHIIDHLSLEIHTGPVLRIMHIHQYPNNEKLIISMIELYNENPLYLTLHFTGSNSTYFSQVPPPLENASR